MTVIRKTEKTKVVKLTGKRILVNPATRWSPGAMAEIAALNLPVEESEYMPTDRLYVLDPEKITGPEIDVALDELIPVEGDYVRGFTPTQEIFDEARRLFDGPTQDGS